MVLAARAEAARVRFARLETSMGGRSGWRFQAVMSMTASWTRARTDIGKAWGFPTPLEDEDAKLKRFPADGMLDNVVPKDLPGRSR